jgi:hypothetical protein
MDRLKPAGHRSWCAGLRADAEGHRDIRKWVKRP